MKIIITNNLKEENSKIEYLEIADQQGSFAEVFFVIKKKLRQPLKEIFVISSKLAFIKLLNASQGFNEIELSELDPLIKTEIKNYLLYQKAIPCAKTNHIGQGYGGFLPYFYHLKQTDKVVDYFFQDIPEGKFFTLKCCAILHDILEDTPITLDQLKTDYTDEVADIVLKVTKINEKHDMDFEKAYYKEMSKNPLSVFIKIADKCSNTKQTLKNKSGWHAKRLVAGHPVFQDYTYSKIEAKQLKRYLDNLIKKMSVIVESGDLSNSIRDGVASN